MEKLETNFTEQLTLISDKVKALKSKFEKKEKIPLKGKLYTLYKINYINNMS